MATSEQVGAARRAGDRFWAGLLLAAFAGLRLGEVCGLRVVDLDFMRGIVTPAVQYPADPLN